MSCFHPLAQIATAATVFLGDHGDVARLARTRGQSRQRLYRQAHTTIDTLRGTPLQHVQRQLQQSQQRCAQLQARVDALQQQLQDAILLDRAKQAQFATTAQAVGVSLSAAHTLLSVFTAKPPSVAQLGRFSHQAARRAKPLLAVLDRYSRAQARQIAADEIFVGKKPVLMTVEQHSMCWLGGRLAPGCDHQEWAQEFRALPALEQVTRDGATGMGKGLAVVNAERRQAGQPAIDDQADHFHLLREGQRALRQVRHKAERALERAGRAQRAVDRDRGRGVPLTGGAVTATNSLWRQAEAAYQRWSTQEEAWKRLRQALRLFSPAGELHTPVQAEATVRAALAELTGLEWQQLQSRMKGDQALTFLKRVEQQLAALPGVPALVRAAVRVEGLKRSVAALQAEGPAAAALRGVLLVGGLALSLAKGDGVQAQAQVQEVLQGVWRSSSLVEGVNSALRMQQARQKRLTAGLLDLKRLHWNMHSFRAGRRKGQSPYQRLGIVLPPGDWWTLLNMSPERLAAELSALNMAA